MCCEGQNKYLNYNPRYINYIYSHAAVDNYVLRIYSYGKDKDVNIILKLFQLQIIYETRKEGKAHHAHWCLYSSVWISSFMIRILTQPCVPVIVFMQASVL